MGIQYLPVSWKEYHALAQKLAASLLARPPIPDEIIAISRGGLTLGHLLSDLLNIPISTISIQSYTGLQTQGEVKIIAKLSTSIAGKHVLIVDDVSDSGKTLRRAVSYVKRLKPKEISTVTLFYKPHSVFRPDYFARQTSNWILFPYEIREMIVLITKNLEREGKSKRDIQLVLEKLGYTDEQIAFVRKYHLQQ